MVIVAVVFLVYTFSVLPDQVGAVQLSNTLEANRRKIEELENRYIARVLAHTKGNMSAAAKILGIDRKTLYRKRVELSQFDPSVDSWDIH